jgi:hypothetical protein
VGSRCALALALLAALTLGGPAGAQTPADLLQQVSAFLDALTTHLPTLEAKIQIAGRMDPRPVLAGDLTTLSQWHGRLQRAADDLAALYARTGQVPGAQRADRMAADVAALRPAILALGGATDGRSSLAAVKGIRAALSVVERAKAELDRCCAR